MCGFYFFFFNKECNNKYMMMLENFEFIKIRTKQNFNI